MLRAKFWVELPGSTWVADVSRSFPDATFRLLSGVRSGETAIELGECIADDQQAIREATLSHPHVTSGETLRMTDERSVGVYETTDTDLYELAERLSLVPEFPVVVEDGWFELDVRSSHEGFQRLKARLDRSDRSFELLSLVEAERPDELLTDRQREVLDAALREGYFSVPRECTLADLAERVEADESTISGILRRAEARVLEWFLTGSEHGAVPARQR